MVLRVQCIGRIENLIVNPMPSAYSQLKNTPNKVAVVVGTVTDDLRITTLPKLTICALRLTEGARARVLKAGGTILTFDQLAVSAPTGKNTVLLQGLFNIITSWYL